VGAVLEREQKDPAAGEVLFSPVRRRGVLLLMLRHPSAMIGLALLTVIVSFAALAPVISPYSPFEQQVLVALQPPTARHIFGTDQFGRDILARVLFGSRVSLASGLMVVIIAMLAGVPLGLAAAYYGNWTDEIISRAIDLLLAFPGFLLALVILAVLGPSLTNAMLAVAISSIPAFTRLVRGSVLSEKTREYIQAARVLGCGAARIMFRHLLPNVVGPILVLGTLRIGMSILTTASLSFLGLGAQPPTPEWGEMLSTARPYVRQAWWLTVFPGSAITITVLAINLLGDGLRDILDPKMRGR
jgi:peptide/nickel transport system permease protein